MVAPSLKGILMRIAKLTLVGSIAALALAAAPALAKNAAPAQKTEDQSISASCHSYQMAADGSWSVLPCHEAGQTEHKPPPKAGEQEPR
jgi:ABC-type phosphate transport system substrate-binding protein